MAKMYEIKNAEGDVTGHTTEPQVHETVLREVKAMGDNFKVISDRLNTELKSVRDLAEKAKQDGLTQEQVQRMLEAVSTKATALEELQTKRMDAIDLAVKRFNANGPVDTKESIELFKYAKEFKYAQLASKGLLSRRTAPKDADINVEELKNYSEQFNSFISAPAERMGMSSEENKYLSVGSDPDGGILVPPTLSARVIQRIWEDDPIRALANVQAIGTDALEMLEDLDEVNAGWEGETVSGGETKTPQFNKKRIPVHIQYARPHATQKLLEDANINVENWLADKVGAKFARMEGAAFVLGSGINKPRGFLTYSTYVNTGVATNLYTFGQIEHVISGSAASVTADGIYKLFYALLEQYQQRATFLMQRYTVQSCMLLKDSTGRYMWQTLTGGSLQAGPVNTLIGIPVRTSASMPYAAASQYAIALADWNEAYQIVDRLGITVQRDPYTVKPFVEFYTRRRVGGDVVNFQAIKLQKIAAS